MDQRQIYALVDPRDGEIRYIGQGRAHKRLQWHLRHARDPKAPNTHRRNWVLSVLNDDLVPTLLILEDNITNEATLNRREREWIAWGTACGWRLTNSTPGGDDWGRYHRDADHRAAMSERLMGHAVDEHTREAVAAANHDREWSEESRGKLSASLRRRWNCAGCGETLSAAQLGQHQRASGHRGRLPA
jgi:hypothetical protein